MLEQAVVNSVSGYLALVRAHGIAVERAIVFGSQATGSAHEGSDIDLLVVSPHFDGMQDRTGINLLWRLAARIDSRIEPIPCGSRQWREDDSSAIIEIARRYGQSIEA